MSENIEIKKILSVIQEPIQIESKPFNNFAEKLGVPVEKVLSIIKEYVQNGIVRRFAGIVKHDRAGYKYNAMVAFEVDPEQCDYCGELLSKLLYVTHCYRRKACPEWPYNLYAMMHARDPFEFDIRLAEIKSIFEYHSVEVLRSVKEYKKSQYFIK
ncbi:MAG: Lrp/AsnC family transcriptional regulator [Fibrobacter sp.]|nr:Lrp/AsnC family transcriptional regulator [Fibrobacter sp.]